MKTKRNKKIEKIRDNPEQEIYLSVDMLDQTVNITRLAEKIDELVDKLNELEERK